MAVFTRTNGNAQNVVSVGAVPASTEASTIGTVVSTGIGKPVQAFSINSNVAMTTSLGSGEAVETILRTIGINSTLLAYQLSSAVVGGITNGLLSVLIEDSEWTTTSLEANIVALGIDGNGYNFTGIKVAQPGLRFVTGVGA
jgi:hypothetical protein